MCTFNFLLVTFSLAQCLSVYACLLVSPDIQYYLMSVCHKGLPRRSSKPVRGGSAARGKKFFVYIVECADGTYYSGYTPDLERRLEMHNSGKGAKYTRGRRPVTLVYNRAYASVSRAMREEYRLKRLTRKQKECLVRAGDCINSALKK